MHWPAHATDSTPTQLSKPIRVALRACIAGMVYLGLFPGLVLNLATEAVKLLRQPAR